jgi:hypothetical protein
MPFPASRGQQSLLKEGLASPKGIAALLFRGPAPMVGRFFGVGNGLGSIPIVPKITDDS